MVNGRARVRPSQPHDGHGRAQRGIRDHVADEAGQIFVLFHAWRG
jgi:hypothetical protein